MPKGEKESIRDPVPCAFLMMVRFHFSGGFSFPFLGNITAFYTKQQKHHILHLIWFSCVSDPLAWALALSSSLFSFTFRFIFCIFYNHVTMVMHFVYLPFSSLCVCIYFERMSLFLFPFIRFHCCYFVTFSVDIFPRLFFRIRLHAYFYTWLKFFQLAQCWGFRCFGCTPFILWARHVQPNAPVRMLSI